MLLATAAHRQGAQTRPYPSSASYLLYTVTSAERDSLTATGWGRKSGLRKSEKSGRNVPCQREAMECRVSGNFLAPSLGFRSV